ncbi:DUF1190 domain-containing protein [Sphingobium sufflavum]|uniref:DUF1190 domain-containing protein n=1 Tax=Sphingobium sufflavum TaxID=1129547 RepID=UPI001F384316|nr:DUF1190 domain-containing protein [Sphingobium sufflavum]MCE7796190.1 DUF1190 domain-containing protein [Sphingobium sufflavum]
MTDTLLPSAGRRKRSRLVRLTTMTAVAGGATLLAGCDGPADYAVDDGPPVEVAAFSDVGECVRSQNFTEVQCRTAQDTAAKASASEAPRFEDSKTCEEEFGVGKCVPATANNQSYFSPLLTGFLVGQLLNGGGGGYRYAPLYRRQDDGSYYTGGGVRLNYGYGANRYYAGSRAMEVPRATPRVQSRSSVISRGGFGGRSFGGGWGG